ncbi:hypothetical protein F4780DRAFT_775970 [Xylariomycetidae sp. FL0641]|nr:hypothetical protein F4780DRAFT_775970 [Xylariomycetidae sp. FL0641]
MAARLISEQPPTPKWSDSLQHDMAPPPRKHSLIIDEGEDDARPPSSKKQRAYYSAAALLGRPGGFNRNADEQSIDRLRARRYVRSPSPEPEPQAIVGMREHYAKVRDALHTTTVMDLEATQASLTKQAVGDINANIVSAHQLGDTAAHMHRGILGARVEVPSQPGDHDNGGESLVKISEVLGELERRIEQTTKDLASAVVGSIRGETTETAARRTNGISSGSPSGPYEKALAEFAAELGHASSEVVEDMGKYEKKFLQRIQNEAGELIKSFLKP